MLANTQEALRASLGRELEVSAYQWPALFLWFVFFPACGAVLVSSPLVSGHTDFVVVVLAVFRTSGNKATCRKTGSGTVRSSKPAWGNQRNTCLFVSLFLKCCRRLIGSISFFWNYT